jgi:GNAT superfamily N-acetyltransferase
VARKTLPVKPIFTTTELSLQTWPDFVKLFSQGNGWDHCGCMHFHRPCSLPKSEWLPTRAARAVRNRRQKRALVASGSSHGILVYANGEPVGWCQYGPAEELPRIENSKKYARLSLPPAKSLWRITCFVVLKPYRRLGVGSLALKAALDAIRRRGGGVIEGYPIDRWAPGTFGNESTHGTASMFANAGFVRVARLDDTRFSSHLVMRKSSKPEVSLRPKRRRPAGNT